MAKGWPDLKNFTQGQQGPDISRIMQNGLHLAPFWSKM
jgi:hypothetical protein